MAGTERRDVGGRGRDAVRVRPRNRKQLILEAAAARFLRQGYAGTAMTDIAADLGVTSTSLYRHFPGKRALLGAVLTAAMDVVSAAADEARPDGFDAILRALAAQALRHRGHPALWQREARRLGDEGRLESGRRLLALRDVVRDALCAERGIAPADAAFLAECALSLLGSVSYHQVTPPGGTLERQLYALAERAARTVLPSRARQMTVVPGPRDVALDRFARREQLILVATRLFGERGYAAVGIEEVAAAAGIAGPSVYHHFTGKAELLAEIIERAGQWIRLYTTRALLEGSTPEESLRLLLRSYAEFALDHGDLIAVSVTEVIHLPATEAAKYRAVQRDGILGWAGLLREADPALGADAARVTVQAVIMMVNDAVRIRGTQDPRGKAALVDDLVSVGVRVLLPEAAGLP
ncbi:TetR/AcrR family transcriptional regulator [Streptomyces sp. NBC_01304]|uniref:TetR/AcrR family transcriptional regulator n=1 Tax=Streptomyces sp. NBC_01304 TaxID=2903818 RepID=UPI002E10C9DE|nr:TetR/AcrR family transcriptional regulator [Streptomyces sp. NBC_01304]